MPEYLIGEVLAFTEKAILIKTEDIGELWIPKSVIVESSDDLDNLETDTEIEIYVSTWFYEQNT